MSEDPDERSSQDGAPDEPRAVRYSRRWFMVFAGIVVASFVGLFAVFRRPRESGGDGTTLGGGLSTVLSSFPVRSAEEVPNKKLSEWVITVDGLVENPQRIDGARWRAFQRKSETADFHCVEGWGVDNLKWEGVPPSSLLDAAGARPEGKYVVFHAYGGTYTDSLPLDLVLDQQTMLADTLDGKPLPAEHGGPVRLVVPRQLGYKNVKWVNRLEVADHPVRGFWEQRGYPMNAPVRG
jgi:sulfoxide reductase catalytic subunit YedY